jgi:hypothetical protein
MKTIFAVLVAVVMAMPAVGQTLDVPDNYGSLTIVGNVVQPAPYINNVYLYKDSAYAVAGADQSPWDRFVAENRTKDTIEINSRRRWRWGLTLTGAAMLAVGIWDASDNNLQSFICSAPWVIGGGFLIAVSF